MTPSSTPSASTDVLVIGAGPAGLATAVAALRHGAQVLVVERRATTSTIPRATGISTRTMEIFRQWDLADAVRAGSVDCEPYVALLPTLAEQPAQVVPFSFPTMREALAVSPAYPALCPQDHIEPLLVDEIRRLGGSGWAAGSGCGPGSWSAPTGRAARCARPWASGGSGSARSASSSRCCSGRTWRG
jgi:2-polyprenyl-6-methoxyphenol hydroxylase-like FAD-dependent oxidoreductase